MEENFGKVDDGARFILECKGTCVLYKLAIDPCLLCGST
ncbi:unnamed protein product [Brassica oleracea]